MRSLSSWLADLQARVNQLNDWVANPLETPTVTWISGLFNPQSFLTAVMQTTAQAQSLELDKLTLLTEVTKKTAPEEFSAAAKGEELFFVVDCSKDIFFIEFKLLSDRWNLYQRPVLGRRVMEYDPRSPGDEQAEGDVCPVANYSYQGFCCGQARQ